MDSFSYCDRQDCIGQGWLCLGHGVSRVAAMADVHKVSSLCPPWPWLVCMLTLPKHPCRQPLLYAWFLKGLHRLSRGPEVGAGLMQSLATPKSPRAKILNDTLLRSDDFPRDGMSDILPNRYLHYNS